MNLNRDDIRIFFCVAIFLGFLVSILIQSVSLAYWYIVLTLLLVGEIMWSEILSNFIREKKVCILGIIFFLIVLYIFIVNIDTSIDDPQMWRLTFLSLLTIGFFYENQKEIFTNISENAFFKYAGKHSGKFFIIVACVGLIITALAVYFNKGISLEFWSMVASACLAFGIFYATQAFIPISKKNNRV
jgi:hypothetical protein